MVYTKTQCFYSYDHNCELSTSHFLKKETEHRFYYTTFHHIK